jgi:hypothetical protein
MSTGHLTLGLYYNPCWSPNWLMEHPAHTLCKRYTELIPSLILCSRQSVYNMSASGLTYDIGNASDLFFKLVQVAAPKEVAALIKLDKLRRPSLVLQTLQLDV